MLPMVCTNSCCWEDGLYLIKASTTNNQSMVQELFRKNCFISLFGQMVSFHRKELVKRRNQANKIFYG